MWALMSLHWHGNRDVDHSPVTSIPEVCQRHLCMQWLGDIQDSRFAMCDALMTTSPEATGPCSHEAALTPCRVWNKSLHQSITRSPACRWGVDGATPQHRHTQKAKEPHPRQCKRARITALATNANTCGTSHWCHERNGPPLHRVPHRRTKGSWRAQPTSHSYRTVPTECKLPGVHRGS